MRLLVFAAATVLAGSLFAADPELVSLATPDAQVMAGVNVEQVMLSPLGQYLLTQTGQLPADLESLIETAGFDPRRDLREILVCSNGRPGGSAIILARGAFDVPKILEAAQASGATIATYKGVPIIQKSKNDSMAFPDATLAITGDDAGVRAAIDRKSAPRSISSALAVQVNQLSTTEDAWFVTMAPLSQWQPQPPGDTGAGGPVAMGPFATIGKVQQASGGVKFGANAVVSLQAVLPTDKDASALADLLRSLAGASDLFLKDVYVGASSLLKNLNATADGQVTKISLTVPESQIEEMIKAAPQEAHREDAPHRQTRPMQRPAGDSANGATPQRIRVGGNVQKAKLVQHPEPVYPPLALQARISGVVRLNVIIGKDGTVENINVSSGHPLLVPPALEAVKQWTYQPTLLNGQPVEVVTQVEVEFSLNQ